MDRYHYEGTHYRRAVLLNKALEEAAEFLRWLVVFGAAVWGMS